MFPYLPIQKTHHSQLLVFGTKVLVQGCVCEETEQSVQLESRNTQINALLLATKMSLYSFSNVQTTIAILQLLRTQIQ
jgi:hypothetical protein